MKGALIALFSLIFIGGCVASWGVGSYNNLVTLSETADARWGDVGSTYQRRLDLIPNLASAVKGYAIHENQTFREVIEARAKASQINLKADQLTPENLAVFQAAQGELSSALSRLLVVVENYPELKANTLFQDLMTQLEGTENRINVARRDYNESVRGYNTTRKRFPTSVIASFFNFGEKSYFEAEEGADKAPKVDFSDLRSENQ